MSEIIQPQIFTVKREDLVFNYASTFEDLFGVSLFDEEEPRPEGILLQKDLGYDFQSECSPRVHIAAVDESLLNTVGGNLSDYNVNVTIEDVCLGIRKHVFLLGLESLETAQTLKIDLDEIDGAAFYRGFEIRCFITRKTDVDPKQNIIWSKSQQIYGATFSAKASFEQALFEIDYVRFANEEDKKDVLAFVEWNSSAVSSELDVDCFQVKANEDLKDQINRLNNNRVFGGFCIRMLAEKILKELVVQCLRYADLSAEPQKDSLHDRVKAFLEPSELDFDDLAHKAQSSIPLEQMQVESEVTKFLQRNTKVGSSLNEIQFGGFR